MWDSFREGSQLQAIITLARADRRKVARKWMAELRDAAGFKWLRALPVPAAETRNSLSSAPGMRFRGCQPRQLGQAAVQRVQDDVVDQQLLVAYEVVVEAVNDQVVGSHEVPRAWRQADP